MIRRGPTRLELARLGVARRLVGAVLWMRGARRSFAAACAVAACLCAAAGPSLHGQERDGAAAAAAPRVRYAGRPLADVLRDLGALGLTVLFTGEVVKPEMRVRDEPVSSDPRRALDEILAPHGLIAREGPGGVLVVVARADAVAEHGFDRGRGAGAGRAGSGGSREARCCG